MPRKHQRHQKQHGLPRRGIIAAGVFGGAVFLVVGMAVWTGRAPQEGKVTSPATVGARALAIGTTGIVTFRPVIPMERSPSPVTAPRDCCACTSRVT
jgi:hypothetical protein